MNKFHKVKSSAVEGVHYDPAQQTLHIQWKNGAVYVYHNVAHKTYTAFMTADSKRGYINDSIHGSHQLRKIITGKKK